MRGEWDNRCLSSYLSLSWVLVMVPCDSTNRTCPQTIERGCPSTIKVCAMFRKCHAPLQVKDPLKIQWQNGKYNGKRENTMTKWKIQWQKEKYNGQKGKYNDKRENTMAKRENTMAKGFSSLCMML
jgi:hypothetical protein